MLNFSAQYYFLLNLFRQRTRILGALYICICFLARTKSLHFGQYQAFYYPKIYGSSNNLKQSLIVVPVFFLLYFQFSPSVPFPLDLMSSNFFSTSLSPFLQYSSISSFFIPSLQTSFNVCSSVYFNGQPSHPLTPQNSHLLNLDPGIVKNLKGCYFSGTLMTYYSQFSTG